MDPRLIYYKFTFAGRNRINRILKKPFFTLQKNIPMYDLRYGNDPIADSIINKTPFLCGKIGGTEGFVLRTIEFDDKKRFEKACEQLCQCAGFFPNSLDKMIQFADLMRETLTCVDMMEEYDKPCEDYFIKKYCKQLKGFYKCMLYMNEGKPWTSVLKGKRVLVIHPFEHSIRKQYENRKLLFDDPEALPDFELLTIKAVQTIADAKDERFQDWFEALEYMCREVDKIDFDVALIGCGAYGLPLGAYIKNKKGKVAIHAGGTTQLFFGISGNRWNNNPRFKTVINKYWVSPSDEERPEGLGTVENGCYW